jgi:hypothetical protein
LTAITANGHDVLEGTISAPTSGAWWAEIQTLAPLVTGDSVIISDGLTSLSGTVTQGGGAVSRTTARITGGNGNLKGQSKADHWKGATVGKILGDICSAAGETKSIAIDPRISLKMLPFWTTPVETGGTSVLTLAEYGGWSWRILTDGSVWLGDAKLGLPEPDYVVLEPHPEDRSYDVAPEGLSLWVGKLQSGGVVQRVEYSLGNKLRCTYWL